VNISAQPTHPFHKHNPFDPIPQRNGFPWKYWNKTMAAPSGTREDSLKMETSETLPSLPTLPTKIDISDEQMEDLSLSPPVDDSGMTNLMPLSSQDAGDIGSRVIPSLNGPLAFRDIPFVILYGADMLFTLLATNGIRSSIKDVDSNASSLTRSNATGSGYEEPGMDARTISIALQSLIVVNALFSVGWLLVFIFYNKMQFLQASCAFSAIGLVIFSITMFSMSTSSGLFWCIVICIVVALDVRWIIKRKSSFDFTCVLFELVVEFLLNHPGLALVTVLTIVAYSFWAFWISSTLSYVGEAASPWQLSMIYLYFHFYWTSNIFKNILTVVVSGAVMIWYYKEDSTEISAHEENISDNESFSDKPTLRERANSDKPVVLHFLRCALTYSFGSICVGSLLCPVAHILWNIVRWVRRDEAAWAQRFISKNPERVEHFIRTFHKYSFVHVAGYGKGFYAAAHDSWELMESRGVEGIVDDDLTSRLLLFGANGWAGVISSVSCAALVASGHGVFFALTCFVLSYTTISIATHVAGAVVKTLFVCFAEHPTRLSQMDPLIYHRLVRLSELKNFRDHKPHF
jgi:hypothetical protein